MITLKNVIKIKNEYGKTKNKTNEMVICWLEEIDGFQGQEIKIITFREN
jgi:hypothetical protein